jgi:hypothetical protein
VSVAAPLRAPARSPRPAGAPAAVRRRTVKPRRLTAGGLAWVGILMALMGGIVALNIAALRGSIDASRTRDRAQALAQQNGLLRAQVIDLSNPFHVGVMARGYGMVLADPNTTQHIGLPPRKARRAGP